REVRAIRLDEDAIGGSAACDLVDRMRILERYDARERQVETEIESTLREALILAEAVDDPAHLASALALENRERFARCGAGVDDERLFHRARERHHATKDFALHVARRVIVMVVEPDLAERSNALAPEQGAKLVFERGVERRSVVRVHADRREHVGAPLGELR